MAVRASVGFRHDREVDAPCQHHAERRIPSPTSPLILPFILSAQWWASDWRVVGGDATPAPHRRDDRLNGLKTAEAGRGDQSVTFKAVQLGGEGPPHQSCSRRCGRRPRLPVEQGAQLTGVDGPGAPSSASFSTRTHGLAATADARIRMETVQREDLFSEHAEKMGGVAGLKLNAALRSITPAAFRSLFHSGDTTSLPEEDRSRPLLPGSGADTL